MEGGFSLAQKALQSGLNTSVFPWHKTQRLLSSHMLEACPLQSANISVTTLLLISLTLDYIFSQRAVSVNVMPMTPLLLSTEPCPATVFFMVLGLSYGLSLLSAAHWKWKPHSRSSSHFPMRKWELLFKKQGAKSVGHI